MKGFRWFKSWATPAASGRFHAIAFATMVAVGSLPLASAALAASVPGRIDTDPIPQARIDAAVTRIDSLAAEIMDKTGVPGLAVAVVQNGGTVFARGYGARELGKSEAVETMRVGFGSNSTHYEWQRSQSLQVFMLEW